METTSRSTRIRIDLVCPRELLLRDRALALGCLQALLRLRAPGFGLDARLTLVPLSPLPERNRGRCKEDDQHDQCYDKGGAHFRFRASGCFALTQQ
jgi:hypothetical protein